MDERRHALPLNGATSPGVTTVAEERSSTPTNKIETVVKALSLVTFFEPAKKVTRPPGRDPARSAVAASS
jgi:hypothetical protein